MEKITIVIIDMSSSGSRKYSIIIRILYYKSNHIHVQKFNSDVSFTVTRKKTVWDKKILSEN